MWNGIAPTMFTYNMAYNKKIATTPHYLNFGLPTQQPAFIQKDRNRKLNGEGRADQIAQHLQFSKQMLSDNQDREELME